MTAYRERMLAGEYEPKQAAKKTTSAKPKRTRRTTRSNRKT